MSTASKRAAASQRGPASQRGAAQKRAAAQQRAAAAEAARQRSAILLAATAVLTVLLYATTVGHDFIAFDDPETVLENASLRSFDIGAWFTTPLQYMYTPLVSMSYALDFALGGLSPGLYHATNVLLHAGNVVLVFFVVRRLTGRDVLAHAVSIAFALHPLNVDTVAWVSTRSTLLSTLFSLAALLAYLRYLDTSRLSQLAVSCGLFGCAALSKSSAVVLPLALVLLDVARRRPLRDWRVWWEKVPFFAIALTLGLVALQFRVDTVNPHGYDLIDRAVLLCWTLVIYLAQLVVPVHLALAYTYPVVVPWYAYLAPVVLVGLVWWVVRSRTPMLWYGLGFFAITIVPSQLVLLIDNYHANRYAYLPSVGLLLAIAVALEPLLSRQPRRALLAGALAIGLCFALLTVARVTAWRDTVAIMSDSIDKEPDVAFTYNSRGIARYQAGDYPGATADLERAVAIDPDFVLALYYRGIIRSLQGNDTGALADFDAVVARYPGYSPGYVERAKTRQKLGDAAGACRDWSAAAALGDPSATPC